MRCAPVTQSGGLLSICRFLRCRAVSAVLLGPNGCGKLALLRALAGLNRASGEAWLNEGESLIAAVCSSGWCVPAAVPAAGRAFTGAGVGGCRPAPPAPGKIRRRL